ncbi:hypothetical protein O181_014804 [Austropuccinia psidii MF-1]|uniref:Uncharacterized protein n=1 Tax=Austropuccinia psidii MF-1 TaxID=1389203 RepID=A0A9Q3GQ77_9BASI|nr:hypothetical protein [Austropuccinia psidii MF-1]
MLRLRAYKDELAIAQQGAFDIVISIAQQLCNSNVQALSILIMTPKQTGAMGLPKLTLYSLFIQLPNPLFKHYHLAIRLHTRNAHSLSDPSNHAATGVPNQDAIVRTPLWSTMMKEFPSGNGCWYPKQADGNDSGKLALSPQVLICPPPYEPSQPNEPPIPGSSPSSEPHEDIPTCEPEPEVALTQYTEEPFEPHLPLHSPPGSFPRYTLVASENPIPSSPHSHDEACQEFTDLRPTLMIP